MSTPSIASAAPARSARRIIGRSTSEASDHAAVVDHLRLRGVKGLVWYHPASGGGRSSKAEAGILKGQGVVPGIPDLMLHHAGRSYGLELKTSRGRLSDAQKHMHARLAASGVEVAVARGLDEALEQLRTWGLLR